MGEYKGGVMGVAADITFEKYINSREPEYNDFDAIMYCVAQLGKASKLSYRDNNYTVAINEIIEVDRDIYFQMIETVMDKETGIIKKVAFHIYSENLSSTDLMKWVRDRRDEYSSISVKDGAKSLYLDQMAPDSDGTLTFMREPFATSRYLSNVFFEGKGEIVDRVRLFGDEKWYKKRGIPHTLGFMFYGPPGCGKTSCTKALANETKRHIINVRLNTIRTNTQLRNLFYNPTIHMMTPESTIPTKIKIPIDKRLYLIEDIDVMTDLVKKRELRESKEELRTPAPPPPAKKPIAKPIDDLEEEVEQWTHKVFEEEKRDMILEARKEDSKDSDRITLSSLLNILDGTLEIPGRMIIITTNRPGDIDKALIRPGRIDAIVNFKLANRVVMCDMFNAFYELPDEKKMTLSMFADIDEYKVSPAELNQIMFRHLVNPTAALEELKVISRIPSDERDLGRRVP